MKTENLILRAVDRALQEVLFQIADSAALDAFHKKLSSELDEVVTLGQINSYLFHNINLENDDEPLVIVKYKNSESATEWKSSSFYIKTSVSLDGERPPSVSVIDN